MLAFNASKSSEEACPFQFNFDPVNFKIGDIVSFRIPERFGEMPFVGTLIEVQECHVLLATLDEPLHAMRASRESRPVVSEEDAFSQSV